MATNTGNNSKSKKDENKTSGYGDSSDSLTKDSTKSYSSGTAKDAEDFDRQENRNADTENQRFNTETSTSSTDSNSTDRDQSSTYGSNEQNQTYGQTQNQTYGQTQ